jgi:hypothetical protein
VRATLLEAADEDMDRCIVCPAEVPQALPAEVLARLNRLLDARASLLAKAGPQPDQAPGRITAR